MRRFKNGPLSDDEDDNNEEIFRNTGADSTPLLDECVSVRSSVLDTFICYDSLDKEINTDDGTPLSDGRRPDSAMRAAHVSMKYLENLSAVTGLASFVESSPLGAACDKTQTLCSKKDAADAQVVAMTRKELREDAKGCVRLHSVTDVSEFSGLADAQTFSDVLLNVEGAKGKRRGSTQCNPLSP